jgi:hypothetical protein
METLDNQSFSDKNGTVSDGALELLRRTIPWMKFVAIMGFIASGAYVIRALVEGGNAYRGGGAVIAAGLITGVLIFFPNLFLFQYASNLSYFVDSRQPFDLEMAFARQRTLYLYTGILFIVVIALVIIAAVFLAGSRMY